MPFPFCLSPLKTQCQPRLRLGRQWFSRSNNFPCNPLPHNYHINWMLIKYIVYITSADFKNNPGQVNICVCISYSIYSTLILRQLESVVNGMRINVGQSIFFLISPVVKGYEPLPSSALVIMVWFHDSACDIEFYQMFSCQIRINYFTWKYNILRYYFDCLLFLFALRTVQ